MNSEEKSIPKSGMSDIKAEIVIAWLPFLVVFMVIPFVVYLSNQNEYDNTFSVMTPFFIFGFISFIFTCAAIYLAGKIKFLGPVWRTRIALFSFYTGVFFLLSDIFTPVKWGPLDGVSKITEPISLTLIQLAFILGLCLCAYKLPTASVRKSGVYLVIILLIIQPFYILANLSKDTVWNEKASLQYPSKPNKIQSSKEAPCNVYQIVFDGYTSLNFIDALKVMNLNEKFQGFTFFKKNMTNCFQGTRYSLASFLTGTFYKKGSSEEWFAAPKRYGIKHVLKNASYNIWEYTPNRTESWCYENASYVRTTRDIMASLIKRSFYFAGINIDTLTILQISLVRTAPNFLRSKVLKKSNSIVGRLLMLNKVPKDVTFKNPKVYKSLVLELFKDFISDENKRGDLGEYVYCHFILPHPPCMWDRNGNYCEDSNYYEQTLCATRLMSEFIDELKRLGKFEKSLIIFQSDHGDKISDLKKLPDMKVPDEITKNIFDGNIKNQNRSLLQFYSLLLVKPPFASNKEMIISEAPTQLADIPSTIYDLAGITVDSLEGRPVFKVNDREQREINFSCLIKKNSEGKRVWRHFSYTNDKGWHVYPEFPDN